MTQAWLIRAGRAGEREQWALEGGVSGGGFGEVQDLTPCLARSAVTEAVATAFTGHKEARIQNFAAQLWALRGRINTGDLVVMPRKGTALLAVGRVKGDYQYLDAENPHLRHVRPVEWVRDDVPRTAVKQDLLYSLGAFLTICEVRRNDAAYRIGALLETGRDPGARPCPRPTGIEQADEATASDASDTTTSTIDIEQYASDQLSSAIIERFAGYRMQELVKVILEADGLTCEVPPRGPDQGVDVLAATGPLGLDPPRLVVQVKSEAGAVGAPVVQQLLGAMHTYQAEQGLLVAWGGVSKPAQDVLRSQYFRVRVWSSADLLDALFRTYDRLPEGIRTELPLKRVWTLVEEAG